VLQRLAGPGRKALTRAKRRLRVRQGPRARPPAAVLLWLMRHLQPSLSEGRAAVVAVGLVLWLYPRARITADAVRARYVRGT
jgi:hypothetical protein